MAIIDIHEFSTGINVKGTKDNWHSHGFTGYNLNSTLANIPKVVRQEGIAADLFELAESSIQQTPALIGREFKLGDQKWSVLAVVNSAWDESKRWITVTRFFITEGLGKLNDLITYQQTNNLKFDPFDKKQLNQPNKYNTSSTKETDILPIVFDDYSSVVNNLLASPLILSSRLTNKNQKIPIKAIHQLAQEKAKISSSSELITWAYNVEGLKKPHDFLVIYSASPQADQYLQQSFQVKQRRVKRKEGEHQILTIIRNWINQADVQQNDIPIINNALLNQSQYDDDFWNISVFDQLGIDNSQGKSGYRLWLLHSLVFSNVSEELLSLYNDKSKDKQYQPEVLELSRNIQLYLSQTLQLAIQSRAFQCVNVSVTNLTSDSKFLEYSINWLKLDKENNGIFGMILKIGYIELLDQEFTRLYLNKEETIQQIINYYKFNHPVSEQYITENLERLNQLIFSVWGTGNFDSKSLENLSVLNTENWLSITNVIRKIIWLKIDGSGLYKKCQVMAEFFEKISQSPASNRISALFYHLSQGEIPTSVWKKCQFGQTLSLPPELGNLEAIKKLAVSANKNTSTTHSSPASTSDELDSQDSQESTTENETLTLLAILIFWLKLLPFLIKNKELAFVLRSHYQEGTTPVPPPSLVTPPSPVSPNDQTSPTTNENIKYEAILYGIPVKRKLTLLEKLQRYFGKSFSLVFGLLFKSHQVPASGLILLTLALLAGSAGYQQVKDLQISHCENPSLLSTAISKMPLIGVDCSPPLPENPTIAALNQIVKNYKDYLEVGETESQAKIIELLDSPRKTYNLDFQQFEPKKWLLFWHSPETQDFSNWTDAIRNYQEKAVEVQKKAGVKDEFILHPTGEIKAKDSTDQYLRCELRKNLQLPSNQVERGKCQKYGVTGLTPDSTNLPPNLPPSPNPSGSDEMGSADWKTTAKALDALRDEIANDYSSEKFQVQTAIIQALLLSASYEYKDVHDKLWIQGIKKFQDKIPNYSGDGFITKDDSTYNLLKCEVAKNLKITLKSPPAECSQNP